MKKRCAVHGCVSQVTQAGMCNAHYRRFDEYGDPTAGPPIRRKAPSGSESDAFRHYMGTRLPEARSCWLWKGTIQTDRGYGTVMVKGNNVLAHRIAYRMFVGPLNDEQVVRHSCDNPPCVNPHHLLCGTQLDNALDCVERGRQAVGSRLPISRLTPMAVRQIRSLRDAGVTQRAIAVQLGVHVGTVQAVIDGKTWKHVVD